MNNMPLTAKDIQIVNAMFITSTPGAIVHETFTIRMQVMNTPFMVPYCTLGFKSEVPDGFSAYQVVYRVKDIQVAGMVLVAPGDTIEHASLVHFTYERDITHAPTSFHADILDKHHK